MSQMTLAEIRRDDRFEGYLLVRAAEQRSASSGKLYLDMTLSDKTGSINAVMFSMCISPLSPRSSMA